MKKQIDIILAVILTMSLLCGCNCVERIDEEESPETSMFVIVERSSEWMVCYQKDTKVMYVISWGMHNTGNFTVMLNPDGTPQLWNK